MNERKQMDFRNVALEKLEELRNTVSQPVYSGLIKSNLKGREMELLRDRLLKVSIPEHDRELERQEELIGYIEADRRKALEDITSEKEFIDKLEAERAGIYARYQEVLAELKKIDNKLEAANKAMAQFDANKKALEVAIDASERRKQEIKRVVLVHRSASIGQLMKYSFGKIVMTEADASYLGNQLIPDVIFDKSLGEGILGEHSFRFRDLSEEMVSSITQFLEMAMYYYAVEEEMPVMLYANSDIATVLKKEEL